MNMKITTIILTVVLVLFQSKDISAQERRRPQGGTITGIITDAKDSTPIEYAYIILFSAKDSAQVTGTVSEEDGRFLLTNIRPGSYYLDFKYMGFNNFRAGDLKIGRSTRQIDLGEVQLSESIQTTGKIEVMAEKPAMTYLMDKKIINVSQHQTATSGTAADVLENVPSVTVDIEGNVSLRGSTSFLVLLDNKPTILEPSEVLQQIPATAIEDIEIITNPSAKFDPDGTAGIINIVTKKDKLNGFSGIVNVNLGLNDKYGADFLLNYRTSKANIYIGGDYNIRNRPGTMKEERWITYADTTSFINSDGNSGRSRNSYSIKGGIDYSITQKDNVSLGLRYGDRSSSRDSELDYLQWYEPGNQENVYTSNNESERSGDFYAINLDYRHQFKTKGHELLGQIIYQERQSDEVSVDELVDETGQITEGRKTLEQGPGTPLRIKLDYTLPLSDKNKIEAGYQSRLGKSEDKASLDDYNTESGFYEHQSQFDSHTEYKRDIHGLYGTYSAEEGKFAYQGGLRTEFTYRNFEMVGQDTEFKLKRWDFFPTFHMSYHLSKEQQMMVSYTRRIKRPRGHSFEPFDTWMDAYNVRRGNPDLKPEYIDSYEMGYQNIVGRSLLSVEAYYRVTNNKIERVRSVYATDITLHTYDNAGTSYNYGTEFMVNTNFLKFWNANLMANLYQYRIEGNLLGDAFSRESFNWNLRFNNTLIMGRSTRFQMNAMYNSKSVSAQGTREGFIVLNLGLRQEFFDRALSATVQVRDLLKTGKRESVSEGVNFYSHSEFRREAPMITLNLSYKIFNYKEKQRRERGYENGEGGDEEDF